MERLYSPDADEKIVAWRLLCFLMLGFSQLDASALAVRRDVDRHDVEHRLIRRGCTPRLAMDIVL